MEGISIGEWIGSSIGFLAVMLSAMGAAVGLVVYAAFAARRTYLAEVISPDRRPAPASIRQPEPGAARPTETTA